MPNYAYRVEALAPNKRAGDTVFLTATSKEDAQRVFRTEHPEMVEWSIEVTKIAKEEMPMKPELPVLVMPPITEVIPGVGDEPTQEERDRYADVSLARIREELLEIRRTTGAREPRLLVQFPEDTTEEGNDSRDTVMLDHHDTVVVIDPGVR